MKYTVVQHPDALVKPGWQDRLSVQDIDSVDWDPGVLLRITTAGGVVFPDKLSAESWAYEEMYHRVPFPTPALQNLNRWGGPDVHMAWVPGSFSKDEYKGWAIYVPDVSPILEAVPTPVNLTKTVQPVKPVRRKPRPRAVRVGATVGK